MDRAQSRALSNQGRQHFARPRRARIDLHRPARAGGRAPLAQGHRDRHGGRQQGRESRDRRSGVRRRRRAVQRALGDLCRLARYAGHVRACPTIACRIRARAARRDSTCSPSPTWSRRASTLFRSPRAAAASSTNTRTCACRARPGSLSTSRCRARAWPRRRWRAPRHCCCARTTALPVHALKISLQFTARLVPLTDILTQGAGALNIPGALILGDAINPNAPRGTNWIRHRLTAANPDAAGNVINWSRRIIYGDRFVRSRYAELHLFRWDDDIVWAYDALAGDIDLVEPGRRQGGVGQRRQHRLGQRRHHCLGPRRQHRLGQPRRRHHSLGHRRERQHRLGHRRQHRVGQRRHDRLGHQRTTTTSCGGTATCATPGRRTSLPVSGTTTSCGATSRATRWTTSCGATDDNIVWGNCAQASGVDNIVWGESDDDNIVWGNLDNIVWGDCGGNNVQGSGVDNIVWGDAVLTGGRR